MEDPPRWPAHQAAFGAGAIILILTAMAEVAFLPAVKYYERLVLVAFVTGILAAVISSTSVCVALAGFAAFLFLFYLGTGDPGVEGGRWPSLFPILVAAVIGRGYRIMRQEQSASSSDSS
jgi:hypothetical protein